MRSIVQFNINFVVAHKLEAKPLIEHFHLKKFIKKPFQIFKNEKGIRLVISGMGVSRARSAVEYICLLYTSPSPRDVEEGRMPSSA